MQTWQKQQNCTVDHCLWYHMTAKLHFQLVNVLESVVSRQCRLGFGSRHHTQWLL